MENTDIINALKHAMYGPYENNSKVYRRKGWEFWIQVHANSLSDKFTVEDILANDWESGIPDPDEDKELS